MKIEDSVKILCEYNKWRKGKGKKYITPGLPFDYREICEAIDSVTTLLKRTYLSNEHFLIVAEMAECYLKLDTTKKKDMPPLVKAAVKAMRKAVRHIYKDN